MFPRSLSHFLSGFTSAGVFPDSRTFVPRVPEALVLAHLGAPIFGTGRNTGDITPIFPLGRSTTGPEGDREHLRVCARARALALALARASPIPDAFATGENPSARRFDSPGGPEREVRPFRILGHAVHHVASRHVAPHRAAPGLDRPPCLPRWKRTVLAKRGRDAMAWASSSTSPSPSPSPWHRRITLHCVAALRRLHCSGASPSTSRAGRPEIKCVHGEGNHPLAYMHQGVVREGSRG